ncbi:ATP-dependent Clp protease adaptor [Planctomycetes bacterium Pan216]|uniref:ATP-dependent Clp protease adaptor n=1 Tax=Kolteria novifilia TaxID=2527975 RepID=A0A518B1F7_9BACT|nr:ATP-dependent Clp protease adaptor [Planctomycetes bacterium Pan216]
MESSDTGLALLPEIEVEERTKQKKQPRYHVILLDDNDHTYEYVIRMLMGLFGFGRHKAYGMACTVDKTGRVILLTTSREHAELKQQQVHAFGPDPLLDHCKGSMTAVLEPTEAE